MAIFNEQVGCHFDAHSPFHTNAVASDLSRAASSRRVLGHYSFGRDHLFPDRAPAGTSQPARQPTDHAVRRNPAGAPDGRQPGCKSGNEYRDRWVLGHYFFKRLDLSRAASPRWVSHANGFGPPRAPRLGRRDGLKGLATVSPSTTHGKGSERT